MNFRFLLTLFVCILLTQTVYSQFDKSELDKDIRRIYHSIYPGRLSIMDSIIMYYYRDSGLDFANADFKVKEILEIISLRQNEEDYLNFKQQRINGILTWILGKKKQYPGFIEEALALSEEIKKSPYHFIDARLYTLIGYYYFTIGVNYRKSFEYLNLAKEIYDAYDVKVYPEKAASIFSIAMLYYDFNDFQSALNVCKLLVPQMYGLHDKELFTYDLMGECYAHMGKYDSARYSFGRVYELIDSFPFNKKVWYAIVKGKIGETWFYENKYDTAKIYLQSALDSCLNPAYKLSDNITVFASRLSAIYLSEKQWEKALYYAQMSIKHAAIYKEKSALNYIRYLRFQMNALKAMENYYRAVKDIPRSLIYSDSFNWMKDKFQSQLDVNQKYQAEMALAKEKSLKDEQIEQSKKQRLEFVRNVLTLLIIVLVIIGLIVYYSLDQKHRIKEQQLLSEKKLRETELELRSSEMEQRKIVEAKNKMIEKSLHEKDLLLNEIHHRVKNNLQIISSLLELQSNRLSDENSKAAIEESKGRVLSIALIHQQLYQNEDFSNVEMKLFIIELIAQISDMLKDDSLEMDYEIIVDDALLHIETAIPLGLILNELLTNSFKYAFKNKSRGMISILLKVEPRDSNFEMDKQPDKMAFFCYKDNGPGLDPDFNINTSKSLGLKLVYQLTKQIYGKLEYQNTQGAEFQINF